MCGPDQDEEEQTSFILAVLKAHKMFRTQIMLSNNIKAVQEGLFTGLVIIPIVLRILDYFISRGIKKDNGNNLSVKLLVHNKQKILRKHVTLNKNTSQKTGSAGRNAEAKCNLEEEKTKSYENVIKAHQHIFL